MTKLFGVALGIGIGAFGAASCAPDVYHDDQVAALGPEAAGVPNGPTHRAGQPCLVCHGGSGPAHAQFSIAGTIDAVKSQADGLPNATVSLTDSAGATHTATTNEVGNFYIPASDWDPAYPVSGVTITLGSSSAAMTTRIGRSGSCATCHFDPASNESVGHVYLALDPSDLPAGVNP